MQTDIRSKIKYMTELLTKVEDRIIVVCNQRVMLDCDVADLYNVETKRINEAVRNNPDRFPEGYYFQLTPEETYSLRSKNSTLNDRGRGKHSKYLFKAFTEKGLYMIATILKSKEAVSTTLAIIETFAKIREVAVNLTSLRDCNNEGAKKNIIKHTGNVLSEILNDNMYVSDSETTLEINFAMLKLKHTIKRKADL